MRRLARQYRRSDKTLEVLSFQGDGDHLGEIVICVPRMLALADRREWPPEKELRLMLVHGVLSLLGHSHRHGGTDPMERMENAVLGKSRKLTVRRICTRVSVKRESK